jgi:hypothetical protein
VQEFFDAAKVTGPTIAVLLVGVIYLWRRNSQLQQKTFDLYDRILAEQKKASLDLMQLLSTQPGTPGTDALAARYVTFLTQRADELKEELARLRPATPPPSASST